MAASTPMGAAVAAAAATAATPVVPTAPAAKAKGAPPQQIVQVFTYAASSAAARETL